MQRVRDEPYCIQGVGEDINLGYVYIWYAKGLVNPGGDGKGLSIIQAGDVGTDLSHMILICPGVVLLLEIW